MISASQTNIVKFVLEKEDLVVMVYDKLNLKTFTITIEYDFFFQDYDVAFVLK